MVRTSISIPEDVEREIDERRHASISRSEWILEAVRVRFLLEDAGSWDGNPFTDEDEEDSDDVVAAEA